MAAGSIPAILHRRHAGIFPEHPLKVALVRNPFRIRQIWIEEHDQYYYLANEVNGERRFIQHYDVADQVSDPWGGFEYRRDWIVKYWKNLKTGEAFTGG